MVKPGFLQNHLSAVQCLSSLKSSSLFVRLPLNKGFLNYPATYCHQTCRNSTSLPSQPWISAGGSKIAQIHADPRVCGEISWALFMYQMRLKINTELGQATAESSLWQVPLYNVCLGVCASCCLSLCTSGINLPA